MQKKKKNKKNPITRFVLFKKEKQNNSGHGFMAESD